MQYIEVYYKDLVNNFLVFIYLDLSISKNGIKYMYVGNINWMKELYKKNYFVQKYNVNISGGGKKVIYYIFLGYIDQGLLICFGNEQYKKFNVMNNINYDVNDWLYFLMKISFNCIKLRGLNQDNVYGDNFMGGDICFIMLVKYLDGNWVG